MTAIECDSATWLRTYRRVRMPRVRLVCLPHAGGVANFFRSWAHQLPSDVELLAVHYPGRQDRLGEAFVDRMDVLADAVTGALRPYLDRPLAVFGHSMGACVAYEVTLRLAERYQVDPVRLFVSGREAPQRTRDREFRDRTDEELIADIRALGEVDAGIFDDLAVRELILPALRADYRLIDAYRPESPQSVGVPITAYVGISDPGATVDGVRAWSGLTTGQFELRVFPGDHFYLVPAAAELLHHMTRHLRG